MLCEIREVGVNVILYAAHGSALHVNSMEDLIVAPSFVPWTSTLHGNRRVSPAKINLISKWLAYIESILIIQMCLH